MKKIGDISDVLNEGFGHAFGVPRGFIATPEWIIIKPGEICRRKNCDFRQGCKGTEESRHSKFYCHYGELMRSLK